MNILVFTTFFHPHVGGLEKNTADLFSLLNRKYSHRVSVICCNTEKKPQEETWHNLDIYRIPCLIFLKKRYALPRLIPLIKTLRQLSKQDIVCTQARFFITSFIGLIYAKKKRIPVIHTERGSDFVVHPSRIVEFICWLYDQTLGRLIFIFADQTIGVSQESGTFAQKMGASKLQIIHDGINFDFWQTNQEIKRKKYNLREQDQVICAIGRILPCKGFQYLIEAIQQIPDKKNLKVLIAGDGEYLPFLKKLIRKHNLQDIIQLLGQQTSEQIREILALSDIFVNPSFYKEGLPTTVIEAGIMGKAIITTDVAGMKETIDDNQNGLLIPQKNSWAISNAINYYLKDPQKRKIHGEEIRKKILQDFDWEKITREYHQIMKNLTGIKDLFKEKNPKDQPLISVGVVSYNAEKFISPTLTSILSQTYSNLEIMILDNNSQDKTPEIIKDFAEKDKRIKFFHSKTNLGPYCGLNFLIKKASGKYFAVLDHDDLWHKDKIQTQIDFMETHFQYIGCGTDAIAYSERLNKYYFQKLKTESCIAIHSSLLYRLEEKKFYDENQSFLCDTIFMTNTLCQKKRLIYNIHQTLTLWRQRADGQNLSFYWFKPNRKNFKKYFQTYGFSLKRMNLLILLVGNYYYCQWFSTKSRDWIAYNLLRITKSYDFSKSDNSQIQYFQSLLKSERC